MMKVEGAQNTSTRQSVHGGLAAPMAARTLLRICSTCRSGQSWQICRSIHALPACLMHGSVSGSST